MDKVKELIACSECCRQALMDSNVKVELLRPKHIDKKEDYFTGDYDFIVKKSDFLSILKLFHEICKQAGINFELIKKNPRKWRIELFHYYGSSRIVYEFWFSIDLFDLHGDLKKPAYVPTENIFAISEYESNRTEVLACFYMTHLLFKDCDVEEPEQVYRLDWFIEKLKACPGDRQAVVTMLRELRQGQKTAFDAGRLALKQLAVFGLAPLRFNAKTERIKLLGRRLARGLRPKRILPVIGTDGTGKGTITELALRDSPDLFVTYRFKNLFRKSFVYRRCYKYFYRAKLEKNLADEKMLPLILLLGILKWNLFRWFHLSKVVIVDRYFVDYLARGIRIGADDREPMKVACFEPFSRLIPITRGLFVFSCSTPTIHSRKRELSERSIQFMENLYLEFVCKQPFQWVMFLSTETERHPAADAIARKVKRLV